MLARFIPQGNGFLRWCKTKIKIGNSLQAVGFNKKGGQSEEKERLEYKSSRKLEFIDGKLLLWKSGRTLMDKVFYNLHHIVAVTGSTGLVAHTFFLSSSLSYLPLYGVLWLLSLTAAGRKCHRNQYLIDEMNLLKGGYATEVTFANSIKRRLTGQPTKMVYYNTIFVDPHVQPQSQFMIAQQFSFADTQKQIGETQVKYLSNETNFLLFPYRKKYINRVLLAEVFKGKIIVD